MSVLSFSTGGGTFRLVELDGFPIDFDGQRKKYFLACDRTAEADISQILQQSKAQFLVRHPVPAAVTAQTTPPNSVLFEIEAGSLPGEELPNLEKEREHLRYLRCVGPVVPVPLRLRPHAPFSTAAGALEYAAQQGLTTMPQLALAYEEGLGELTGEAVYKKWNRC